jgi:hypothetical protein
MIGGLEGRSRGLDGRVEWEVFGIGEEPFSPALVKVVGSE